MDLASLLPLVIKASIVLAVLGLGLGTRFGDALYLFRHPRLLLRSLLSMLVIMPLIAAGLVVAFDLPVSVKIALVALSVSPVPPLIPRKELAAGAYAPYAIGLFFTIAAYVKAVFLLRRAATSSNRHPCPATSAAPTSAVQ